MRILILILIAVIFIPLVASADEALKAVSVDDIKVIKISGNDEKAVIKTADRALQIINVGDQIGENGKVVEIAEGRVVIEELTDKGKETIIIRLENGKQKVERITTVGDEGEQLYRTE